MTSSIKLLKAAHGDAFIITCHVGDNCGVIVVDGGAKQTRIDIQRQLNQLSNIDLIVLTHYDDDHVTGLIEYIKVHRKDQNLPFSKLWVNCAKNIDFQIGTDISYIDANIFADYLRNMSNMHNLEWTLYVSEGDMFSLGFANIEIVSPTKEIQLLNKTEYEREKRTNALLDIASQRVCKDRDVDLITLSNNRKKMPSTNDDIANFASIAFILYADNFSILMLGDAYPENIVAYLKTKGYSSDNKLKVDYIKVSHHGSRNNTSNQLLDMIDCQQFIISTNGGFGNSYHPDRETLANILCHPTRNIKQKVTIYLNYPLEQVEQRTGILLKPEEFATYNCEIKDNVEEIRIYEYD